MRKQYTKYYRTLGVEPGVTWAQLRKAYKGLVNTWHPDRFQQDPRQKNLAEERTKEITQSYQELAEYYKEFGVLPHAAKAMETPVTDGLSPQNSPDAHPVHENQDIEIPTVVNTPPKAHKSHWDKLNVRIMATTVLAGIAYLVWQGVPWERPDDLSLTKKPMQQSDGNNIDEDSGQHVPADVKYFTYGAPLGEVYAIQGVPTKAEQDIWYYGKSKVYFAKGKVLYWEEDPNNPLKAKITQGNEKTNARFFEKGSSKSEVLAVQGKPDRDAGNVWDYGVSRVYFDKDRVKGWDESPFNPLRIRQ
jgi:hypothetical protein